MNWLERVHGGYVYGRRLRRLSAHLARLLPREARVLDVGCGDGALAAAILRLRPDVSISGLEVLPRPDAAILVQKFDGKTLPFQKNAYDVVMFADVLHHTQDPMILLREAARVAKSAIVLKDHTRNGLLSGPTLRLMDQVGNARHGVALPFNYWPHARWLSAFAEMGWQVDVWKPRLRLYPFPASCLFDRSLHFVARLSPIVEKEISV